MYLKHLLSLAALLPAYNGYAQTQWVSIDALYEPLPSGFHVFRSTAAVEGKPNVMYYAIAPLNNDHLQFQTDTSKGRRLTPSEFFIKNSRPLLVVNGTFFSYSTNGNLNAVVKDGQVVSYNAQDISGKGRDNGYYFHPFYGTFGIYRNRTADIAWTFSDTTLQELFASQEPVYYVRDTVADYKLKNVFNLAADTAHFTKWDVSTAIGGGPVLVQNGRVSISNNAERKFYGKAIDDRHPRTSIGYTADNQMIVFVCEGRSERAAGLTLGRMATIMKDLGCIEALNLDGGGSSCLLINGKEVNRPSSKGVQRSVPSVFIIQLFQSSVDKFH